MNRQTIGLCAAAGVALFLLGFIPEYLKARGVATALENSQEREQVYRLRDKLGNTFLQITLRNFGLAQESASAFFSDARQVASSTGSPELRSTLQQLLNRRDDVAAKLGRGAAEAYSDVQELYRTLVEQTRPILSRLAVPGQ